MKTKRRIYIADAALQADAEIALDADQSHYLVSVLRLDAGADVHLFNAEYGEWRGEITAAKKNNVRVKLIAQTRTPEAPTFNLTLAFAPLKKDRTDFLIEKASELGVHIFQPVFTEHTQSERVNIERLQATAIEAAEQCDRLDAPVVLPAQKLAAYLSALPKDTIVFLAAESGDAVPIAHAFSYLSSRAQRSEDPGSRENLKQYCEQDGSSSSRDPGSPAANAASARDDNIRDIHFIIGPEGGFSAAEFESFARYPQIRHIRLGSRLLRAETAAAAVLAAFQAIAGDWR